MAEADNSPIAGKKQASRFGTTTDPQIGAATQFKPGQSGNPAGTKPGTVHISTHIQRLMEDEDFEANILDPKIGIREYKGAPVRAVLQVALTKAINGDLKATDLLMKYGWSQKIETEHSGEQKLIIEKRGYSE
jgi:hypothetical protein